MVYTYLPYIHHKLKTCTPKNAINFLRAHHKLQLIIKLSYATGANETILIHYNANH